MSRSLAAILVPGLLVSGFVLVPAGCDDVASDPPRPTGGLVGAAGGPGGSGGAAAGGEAGGEAGGGGVAGHAGGEAGEAGQAGQAGQAGAAGQAGQTPVDPLTKIYPTPRVLFDQAISPSCSLNAGQCHNGWALPDLTDASALFAQVGALCQTHASNPAVIVDECEPPGDRLRFEDGTEQTLLAVLVPQGAPPIPRSVLAFLGGPAGQGKPSLLRQSGGTAEPLALVATTDPKDPSVLHLDLTGLPDSDADAWDLRDWPRPAGGIQVADPNGNGVVGGSLGWKEMVPGAPEKSFFYERLLDNKRGARMPLVQGNWGAPETRAVYCFVRGVKGPDAAQLDEPIDYAGCPEDLVTTVGFPAVASIMKNKCSIPGCHGSDTVAADLDLTPTVSQFSKLLGAASSQRPDLPLITPGDPAKSYLYCKIDPDCADRAPGTKLMPRGQDPLGDLERSRIADWITAGALFP